MHSVPRKGALSQETLCIRGRGGGVSVIPISSSSPGCPYGTHLTPLGLFLMFCTSRVSSSFNLEKKKKGNVQVERPSAELGVK